MKLSLSRLRSSVATLAAALVAGLLLAPFAAQAQTNAGGPPAAPAAAVQADMGELRLDLMDTELDLTDEQRAQVQSILDEQEESRQAMIERYRGRAQNADSTQMQALREEMGTEAESMQSEMEVRLADALDAEQMEDYRALYAEEPAPDAEPVPTILERRQAQLDLTEEQRREMRPIIEGQVQQMESLREEARQARGDRAQMQQLRERALTIQEEADTQMEEVLTEEQARKYEQIQEDQQEIQEARQQMRQRRVQQMRRQMQNGQQQGGQRAQPQRRPQPRDGEADDGGR